MWSAGVSGDGCAQTRILNRGERTPADGRLEVVLNFPRLSSMFGMQVSALDAPAIEAAIARNEAEDFDLDWKAKGYPNNEKSDSVRISDTNSAAAARVWSSVTTSSARSIASASACACSIFCWMLIFCVAPGLWNATATALLPSMWS